MTDPAQHGPPHRRMMLAEVRMGLEARCRSYIGGQAAEVKALLESDELILRGEHRARLAFSTLDEVEAADGQLRLRHAGDEIVLELGPAAARWAEKIRNPRTLLDKLGVKAGQRVAAIGLTDADLLTQLRAALAASALSELPPGGALALPADAPSYDLLFAEIDALTDLAQLTDLRAAIASAGAVWVLHPKGRPDLKDTDVMAAGRAAGLVDNKVARISDRLSALRFVIPKAARR